MEPRLTVPRLAPVTKEDWTPTQQELLQPMERKGQVWNVFATIANHPDLMRDWMTFATYILNRNSLPARDREILILRIGWLCRAPYEWAQHVRIGRKVGLTERDIEMIQQGPASPGASETDRLLLQAVDELHKEALLSDATWQALSKIYDQRQMMDLVFTVGQYNLVSMALNSFGVQLDEALK